jgi:hypothetical protein
MGGIVPRIEMRALGWGQLDAGSRMRTAERKRRKGFAKVAKENLKIFFIDFFAFFAKPLRPLRSAVRFLRRA